MMAIKAGKIIRLKPEWQDAGDEKYIFRAIEDECDGSVDVQIDCGLPFKPVQRIQVYMIAEVQQ